MNTLFCLDIELWLNTSLSHDSKPTMQHFIYTEPKPKSATYMFKGIVRPTINILQSFTNPQVATNLYGKPVRRYFEECWETNCWR